MVKSITYNEVTFCNINSIAAMSLPIWLEKGMRFFRFSNARNDHKQKDLKRVWELAKEAVA